MKKTSLYIEEEVDAGLARRAAQEGVSKAEIIRRALRDAAANGQRPPFEGIGVFNGPPDLAANTDDYLEGFGER
ncbi:MAG TPA: CopG family transcriptional regulator [Solirubrobacteraceae bacterium]|jgi:hypothetical protein